MTAAGFGVLAVVGALDAPLAFFLLGMLVLGAGAGLLGPAPGAAAGDVVARLDQGHGADGHDDAEADADASDPAGVPADTVGPARRPGRPGGKVIAAFQMAGDLGAVTGPLAAGALADGPGFGAAFGVCAAVLLVGTAAAAVSPEPLDRAAGTAAAGGGPDSRG